MQVKHDLEVILQNGIFIGVSREVYTKKT